MIKNKLDYKLINLAIIVFILFLLYQTGHLWMGIINKFMTIFLPFFFAFVFAYALYPMLKFLEEKRVPKGIGILIIMILVFGVMAILIGVIIPQLFGQLSSLFGNIIASLDKLADQFDFLNIGPLQDSLNNSFNQFIVESGKYVSNGALNIIGLSIGFLSIIAIVLSTSIYFLSDMRSIRVATKEYLKRKSKRLFNYIRLLDFEMKSYLTGFIKILFITFFEYTFVFMAIGHPSALVLGFLAAMANLIPYFGGLITNIIAIATAFAISPDLFYKTLIVFFILSTIDGYVINPLVYGKTNKIHPIIIIMSVFAGGILFGAIGIMMSLPLAILIITTYKYFEEDISGKIEDMKTNNKRRKNVEND